MTGPIQGPQANQAPQAPPAPNFQPNFPGMQPPMVPNFEASGQQLVALGNTAPIPLSLAVTQAAERYATASNALEAHIGGRRRTQAETDNLDAARDDLAQAIQETADANDILDPAARLMLGVRSLQEAADYQVQQRPEAGRFIRWWQRMGETRGGRFWRSAAVVGLPLAVLAAATVTGGFGLLPAVAVAAKAGFGAVTGLAAATGMGSTAAAVTGGAVVGAAKGALVGGLAGRARSAIDRYADNTREAVRARLDGRLGAMATDITQQIYGLGGQAPTPAQVDAMWAGGLGTMHQASINQRIQNQEGADRARRYGIYGGAAFGALFGGLAAGIQASIHGGHMEAAPGGENQPPAQLTPEQVKEWLAQHQPKAWALNADNAAADHDGGRYLWNDVQKGGSEVLSDRVTLKTIIPGVNELQAHGAHIDGGGDIHLDDGKWVPGDGKWWFDKIAMPRGGMYAVDADGKVFYFHGRLDNEHAALLLDLMRNKAEIFNRSEFANYVVAHDIQGIPGHVDGGTQVVTAPRGVAPNVTYAGQGRYYVPGGGGNPEYWDHLNDAHRTPNVTYAGQGQYTVPGGTSNPEYWAYVNGQSTLPQNPYDYQGSLPAGYTELASTQYLDMNAAVDGIVRQYDVYAQIPVSDTDPSPMVETLIRDNAAVIRSLPVNFQDQLVARLAEAAQVEQETVRRALEEVLQPTAAPRGQA